jgi:hypothetical protein
MSRLAICVGVDNPGGRLVPLRTAASSATKFGAWLKDKQDFDRVRVLADSPSKPVLVNEVADAVEELVNAGPEQLLIYFSGHGVLNGQSEIWLLSRAGSRVTEAIDLTASREQARLVNVPNVVFISDACRTLPNDLLGSAVTGSPIFPVPNTVPATEGEVDVFFAAPRTGPALEVPIDGASNKYESLFTEMLLRAYVDPPEQITLRLACVGSAEQIVVPNRKLRPVLIQRVQLEAEKHFPGRAPTPVLRLESGETSYIGRAEFTPPGGTTFRTVLPEDLHADGRELLPPAGGQPATMPSAPTSFSDRLAQELQSEHGRSALRTQRAIEAGTGGFETRTGIEVSGARLVDAVATSGTFGPSVPGADGRARWHFRTEADADAPRSAAVIFEGGGTIVTCLPNFVTSITVVEGRVVNVSFVPARNSPLWPRYEVQADEVNSLRARVATVARLGKLDIEPEAAAEFANTIRELKAYDPTLGLYAAYAYAEIGALKDIRSVRDYMRRDIGADLYDVALLATRGDPRGVGGPHTWPIAPSCPMLSQGWSYAAGYNVRWHPLIGKATRLPSLWTTFDRASIDRIALAIRNGELDEAPESGFGARSGSGRKGSKAA